MRTLYLDSFSGISGDMFLGLLIDLGADLEHMKSELARLPVSSYRLEASREKRMEIEGCRVHVLCEEEHHHRTWSGIDAMIAESELDGEVKALSRRIFRRIGEAEAKIHGKPLADVHFHEVGAVDSIVDIIGAAIGLLSLGVNRVLCSPLPLSQGVVECAHGTFPLPAPATLEILKGFPVRGDSIDKELVTPTGAAIAAEIATFAPLPDMRLEKIGYGVGGRDLKDRPNLLRGLIGETLERPSTETDRVAVLETHLDDGNPEWLGALMEKLLEEGALDVAYSPLQMKKNRPGTRLTVIAPLSLKTTLSHMVMQESSAIGVRCYETERLKLKRQTETVETPLGSAEVKIICGDKGYHRITPEYESCRELARRNKRPLPEVYRIVEKAAEIAFPLNT